MPGYDIPSRLTRTPEDRETMQQLVDMLHAMKADELERFYRGTFNALTVATVVLQDRFPDVWAGMDRRDRRRR